VDRSRQPPAAAGVVNLALPILGYDRTVRKMSRRVALMHRSSGKL
jgi:hypothetical protein